MITTEQSGFKATANDLFAANTSGGMLYSSFWTSKNKTSNFSRQIDDPIRSDAHQETESFGTENDTLLKEGVGEIMDRPHTSLYIEYHFKQFINQIISDLDKWIEFGTDDSLHVLVHIKHTIESKKLFFDSKPEHRILYTSVAMLFENKKWSKIELGKIKVLRSQLSRFKDGKITRDQIRTFNRSLFKAGIRIT